MRLGVVTAGFGLDMFASSRTYPLTLKAPMKVSNRAVVAVVDRNWNENSDLNPLLERRSHSAEDNSRIAVTVVEGTRGRHCCSRRWALCSYCHRLRPFLGRHWLWKPLGLVDTGGPLEGSCNVVQNPRQ